MMITKHTEPAMSPFAFRLSAWATASSVTAGGSRSC